MQLAGQIAPSTVGTLQLANFVNPAGPAAQRRESAGRSRPPAAPRRPVNPDVNGLGTLQQGAVESSNVDVVEEMVNMIETQRAYEMNTKAIETNDQMLQYLDSNL